MVQVSMKKIAIIKLYETQSDEYGSTELIAQQITEWKEVSDDDLLLIQVGANDLSYRENKKRVIVEFSNQDEEITKCLEKGREIKERSEKERFKREADELKKRAETVKNKEELFEQLKKELGK